MKATGAASNAPAAPAFTPRPSTSRHAVNLAASIAEHGHSVGVVDADGHIPFSIVGMDSEMAVPGLIEFALNELERRGEDLLIEVKRE